MVDIPGIVDHEVERLYFVGHELIGPVQLLLKCRISFEIPTHAKFPPIMYPFADPRTTEICCGCHRKLASNILALVSHWRGTCGSQRTTRGLGSLLRRLCLTIWPVIAAPLNCVKAWNQARSADPAPPADTYSRISSSSVGTPSSSRSALGKRAELVCVRNQLRSIRGSPSDQISKSKTAWTPPLATTAFPSLKSP